MKNKQQEIFEDWLSQHKGLLFKVVRAYAFNQADRDDLFQEITLQVWKSIPGFKGSSAVTTWLYRVSLNTAIKWSRKENKHSDGRQPITQVEGLLRENTESKDERLTWLYEQIAHLNKIDRSLTLLMLDGFSYKEMAKMLGISESNIGVRIHRIKQHLIQQSKTP